MEFCFLNDFCDSTNFTHRDTNFIYLKWGPKYFIGFVSCFKQQRKIFLIQQSRSRQIRYFESFRPKIIKRKIGKALKKYFKFKNQKILIFRAKFLFFAFIF